MPVSDVWSGSPVVLVDDAVEVKGAKTPIVPLDWHFSLGLEHH
jgi:hypothetical protein